MIEAMFLIIVLILVAFLGGYAEAVERAKKFPPISDDEFIRRCGPEIPPEIALRVRETLSDALGIDKATIYPEHRLVEDLGAE